MRRGLIVPTLPVEFVEGSSATLSPSREYWVTAAARLTLAKSARLGDRLKVINSTDAALSIFGGGNPVSGVDNSANRYSDQSAVRLPANGEADFVRSRRGWRARGCDCTALTFGYNGSPLALNDNNPNRASDVIHYWGGVSNFVNPANSVIIATQSSTANSGTAAVTTDRVANPSTFALNWQANNLANSWIAWQFPTAFAPTGILIQTATYTNNYHPRSFRIHYSNDLSTALTPSSPVASWTQGPGWANQAQITGAGTWHLFPFSGGNTNPVTKLPQLRRLAIFFTGPSSDGANFPTICEVNFFGDLFV